MKEWNEYIHGEKGNDDMNQIKKNHKNTSDECKNVLNDPKNNNDMNPNSESLITRRRSPRSHAIKTCHLRRIREIFWDGDERYECEKRKTNIKTSSPTKKGSEEGQGKNGINRKNTTQNRSSSNSSFNFGKRMVLQKIHDSPHIYTIENFLTDAELNHFHNNIIREAEKKGTFQKSFVDHTDPLISAMNNNNSITRKETNMKKTQKVGEEVVMKQNHGCEEQQGGCSSSEKEDGARTNTLATIQSNTAATEKGAISETTNTSGPTTHLNGGDKFQVLWYFEDEDSDSSSTSSSSSKADDSKGKQDSNEATRLWWGAKLLPLETTDEHDPKSLGMFTFARHNHDSDDESDDDSDDGDEDDANNDGTTTIMISQATPPQADEDDKESSSSQSSKNIKPITISTTQPFPIRQLEYDPCAEGGYESSSISEVVFINDSLVYDISGKIACCFRPMGSKWEPSSDTLNHEVKEDHPEGSSHKNNANSKHLPSNEGKNNNRGKKLNRHIKHDLLLPFPQPTPPTTTSITNPSNTNPVTPTQNDNAPQNTANNQKCKTTSHRTSSFIPLNKTHDSKISSVESRAAELLNLRVSALEPIQLVRYSVGDYFDKHHDLGTLVDHTSGMDEHHTTTVELPTRSSALVPPRRLVTLFVYLNDVPKECGGATRFDLLKVPKSNMLGQYHDNDVTGGNNEGHDDGGTCQQKQVVLEVQPKRGMALLFCNIDRYGMPEPLTVHSGGTVLQPPTTLTLTPHEEQKMQLHSLVSSLSVPNTTETNSPSSSYSDIATCENKCDTTNDDVKMKEEGEESTTVHQNGHNHHQDQTPSPVSPFPSPRSLLSNNNDVAGSPPPSKKTKIKPSSSPITHQNTTRIPFFKYGLNIWACEQ